jgi:GTP-binding protein
LRRVDHLAQRAQHFGHALTPEAIKQQTAKLKKACKKTPVVLSSASGQGVPEVLRALRTVIDTAQEDAGEEKSTEAVWQP